MACVQISPRDNPPDQEEGSEALSSVQQTMLQKLGPDALPITLRVSPYAPPSVRLRPARDYHGSPLGVTYDLKVFVGESLPFDLSALLVDCGLR
ncbi:hypothetical protein LAZ67_7003528 [Cordylochernes scorpioides]|uniref:Uncharacterized protein n=1 Tax=Cordylochernes scorpioides TaxID=51811 RepID=A0ABY6KNU5_9ARAC|nr:hypothetical protein LAZ67_7003528 [Cordylochernes scorpioides]